MNQSAVTGGTPPNFLERISGARAGELAAALWAFVYFFSLLASYYVLRPIRDEMAVQAGSKAIAELFTWVFFAMLVIAPIFGWLTSTFPRKKLLPWIYAFAAANLVGFYLVMNVGGEQTPIVGRVFYVWVSVFNLFVISVFWSFMADLFDAGQAKRLYGFIAAGGTVGALVGPIITSELVATLGPKNLMLVSGAFLILAIVCIGRLRAWETSQNHDAAMAARNAQEDKPIGGSIFAGLRDVLTDPYLLAICGFLFAYSLLSTLLYFGQIELLPTIYKTPAERTQLLARVDLAVNLIVLAIQVLAFSTMIRKLGTRFMLAAMPVVSVIGFACLALAPALLTLMVFGVARRAGEYAISKPARETLFNVLPEEQKYKAKNVIDTLVHRTGDVSSTYIFKWLQTSFGMGLAQLSWLAVPVGVVWLAIAVWLGGEASRRATRDDAQP
jgi:ATP:ADP antiporter, AAA family